MSKRSFIYYIMVFFLISGLLSLTSCKRARVADPDMQGPAGFRVILSGTANPSTLHVPNSDSAVSSHLTVTALHNNGTPVANKEVIFQDGGYGYFENFEVSVVRRTDAAGVVNMTYYLPPAANIKAEFVTYITVTLVDDGRLDSAHGLIFDTIPIRLVPYMTQGVVLHGHVLTPAGNGVGEVTVTLAGEGDNMSAITVTRSSGSYEFYVPGGWYGSISASAEAYSFSPPDYTFTETNPVTMDLDGLDFIAIFAGGNTLFTTIDTWNVGAEGGTITVDVINSTGDSSIGYLIVPNTEWLTVNPSSGSTPGSFKITATPNTTGADRSGTILISATDTVSTSISVNVEQSSNEVSGDARLEADRLSIDEDAVGNDESVDPHTINVYNSGSNESVEYLITTSDTWIHTSETAGATDDSFDVWIDPNVWSETNTAEARSGWILLTPTTTGVSGNVRIAVSQDAGPSLTITMNDNGVIREVDSTPATALGATFDIMIDNNTAPEISLSYSLDNADSWFTAAPITGSVPATLTLIVNSNATGDSRTAVLYITVTWPEVTTFTRRFTVYQSE